MFNNFLPMTGFEPRTSGIGSDRSTNWATQPLPRILFFVTKRHEKRRAPQLSGVVCAFHALSTEAPGSNPKHSRYAFSWFIWLMLLLSPEFVIELWNRTEIWKLNKTCKIKVFCSYQSREMPAMFLNFISKSKLDFGLITSSSSSSSSSFWLSSSSFASLNVVSYFRQNWNFKLNYFKGDVRCNFQIILSYFCVQLLRFVIIKKITIWVTHFKNPFCNYKETV